MLREFTAEGIQEVHFLLDVMKSGEAIEVTAEFLEDEQLTRPLELPLAKRPKEFENRFALATWLNSQLAEILSSEDSGGTGMWTWLAMSMIDVIAPRSADGTRKIRDRALYVLEPDNWKRYYRHLLAGPCRVVHAHWDELHITRAILAGKPHVPGEVYEQIASRQEVITSPALLRLTQRLYWNDAAKALKRGAGGKGAGSARRLAAILLQLELTWDLAEISDDALINLLPREFAGFVRASPGVVSKSV